MMDGTKVAKELVEAARELTGASLTKEWKRMLPGQEFKIRWDFRGLGATEAGAMRGHLDDMEREVARDVKAIEKVAAVSKAPSPRVVVYPGGGSIEIGAVTFATPDADVDFVRVLERLGFRR